MWSSLILFTILLDCVSAAATPYCKPLPNGTDWPSATDWSNLNQTVSGRLTKITPPGIVCQQSNTAACSTLKTQWTDTGYHYSDIPSVDYADETCYPSSTAPCSADGYPAYAISVTNAADVQAGVNFAAKTGVRLVVKATGHDILQRSSGAGSLLIHTAGLKGLTYRAGDSRATKLGGIGSVKISAGQRFRDIYTFAYQNGFVVVGGGEPSVGIAGWVTGGGHSPISAIYGLGADQVLEMEVVTPDGQFRTINADTADSDLFWAMRGGGGSTFAIMISVTMKVYPPASLSYYSFSYNTDSDSDTFWKLATYFHTQLPTLADKGLYGYYFINAVDSSNGKGTISGQWLGVNKTTSQISSAVTSLESSITSTNFFGTGSAQVTISRGGGSSASFSQFFANHASAAVGTSGRVQSRLLDTKSLTSNTTKLNSALRAVSPKPWTGLGHLLTKPGAWSPPGGIAGGSNAVLPAWRTSISHLVLPEFWTPLNAADKSNVCARLKGQVTNALVDLAPDTGAYSAESYPTTPNWQQAFHGSNYARLLSIKNKYDPNGLFWCVSCVGSELWTTTGWSNGAASEGIGQDLVRLCKAS